LDDQGSPVWRSSVARHSALGGSAGPPFPAAKPLHERSPAVDGWKQTAELVKTHKINMEFGTKHVPTLQHAGQQANNLARFSKWFSSIALLGMIASSNGELLSRSGARNPYQAGPLGVIEEGAYADILLVEGNPLEDVSILGDDGKNIPLIMKDGRIYKNALR